MMIPNSTFPNLVTSYAEAVAYALSTRRVRECVRSLRGITGNRWQDGAADWKFAGNGAHRTRPYPMGFYADDPNLYWAISWGMHERMLPWERWLVMRARKASVDRSPQGHDPEEGHGAEHESAVAESETPNLSEDHP